MNGVEVEKKIKMLVEDSVTAENRPNVLLEVYIQKRGKKRGNKRWCVTLTRKFYCKRIQFLELKHTTELTLSTYKTPNTVKGSTL